MLDLTKNHQKLSNLPKPDAIIFDWDNTLCDTWPLIQMAINKTMKFMNQPEWNLQKVKDTIHKSMRESFPEIFGQNWQEAGAIYKQNYLDVNLKNLHLLKNSLELLQTIKQKNILQFLVSNKIGSTLRSEIKKLQLEDLFFSVIGAQDSDFDKPHQAPVDLALLSSGIDLSKHVVWFVGDTIADVNCAKNINAHPIVYCYQGQISKTLEGDILKNGYFDNSEIPIYYDHQELIDMLNKF
jgi:phosphoglycolate phosphatase